jgi:Zn-dependent protease with chaperone function
MAEQHGVGQRVVVNLVTPAPDLFEVIARATDRISGSPGLTGTRQDTSGPGSVLTFLLLAVPGLLAMLVAWWLVRRFLLRNGLGGVLISAGGRPPDPADAEEHQLVNIVEEISIAAGIQPPRVLVLPAAVPNAAAFGRSPDNWTIAVSRGLLDDLDRDATQGVVAHLVGSVGNGDLRMQHSLLSLYVARQLAQDTITMPFARVCRQRVWLVGRMLRGKASPEEEARTIQRLLTEDEEDTDNLVLSLNYITFKVAQFYTNIFVVGGLLTLPFRVRRYLADATAVQLTRSADGLGRALVHLREHGRNLPGAGFAAIYTVTASDWSPEDGGVQDALVLPASLHPPLHKRVDRLRRLGFRHPEPAKGPKRRGGTAGADWPAPLRWLLTIVVAPVLLLVLAALGAMLIPLVLVGIALSMFLGFLFWALVTAVVVVPLHAVLRGLA